MCVRHSYEELVTKGIVDVFISVSLDENALLICMNKSLVSLRDVYPKLRRCIYTNVICITLLGGLK